MQQLPFDLEPYLPEDPRLLWGAGLIGAAVIGLFLLLVVWLIWRRLRRIPQKTLPPPVQPDVDLAQLAIPPNPHHPTRLELYGTPVRIAAIVLAPVGREPIAPGPEEFSALIDQLVPGFAEVVQRDQPVVRIWEPQVSSQGFIRSFSNRIPLPGDRGKGTPWCSVAGKFTAFSRQHLVGIVCCSDGDNALSQYVIQHEGQWNDVLRVRRTPL